MNEEQILKKLASAARGDGPPRIDVAERVLADLAVAGEPRNLLLWVFTATSAAAASVVAVLALRVWAARQDPFSDFLESMMAVMQ